jgi:membrane protein
VSDQRRNQGWLRRVKVVATEVAREWKHDNATLLAAAVAFYGLFSIAPLLLLIVAISAQFLGAEAAREEAVRVVAQFMNERTAVAVEKLLVAAVDGEDAGVTIVSGVLLLFGASGVFRHLRTALNLVLDVPDDESPGWQAMLRGRVVAVVMVILALPVLIASVVLTATLATIRKYVPTIPAADVALWRGVEIVVTTLILALIVAAVLKFVPDVRLAWRNVAVGSIVAALLFAAGRYALGLYIARTNVTSLYGAAASLFVILVSIFFAVAVLLLAAELTEVLARRDSEFTRDRHRRQAKQGYAPRKDEVDEAAA